MENKRKKTTAPPTTDNHPDPTSPHQTEGIESPPEISLLYNAHTELPKCEEPSTDVEILPSYDEAVQTPPPCIGFQGQEILNIFQGNQQLFADQWSRMYYECLANPITCARDVTKDRYPGNQFTYAHSRVMLEQEGYINANYIMKRQYIAAQAPLENTIADFWNMIWRDQVTIVVMLTKLRESGKLKALRYWPTSSKPHLREISLPGQNLIHYQLEPLRKETLAWETDPDEGDLRKCIVSRQIKMKNTQTKEERIITQIQYTGWPDHGCPDDLGTFVKLLVHVHNLYESIQHCEPVPPLVVHCSAGIGRTGTFLTLFHQLREAGAQFQKIYLQEQQLVDASQEAARVNAIREFLSTHYFAITETIMKLREDRSSMVQSESQHYFCFQVIHAILHPDSSETLLKLLFPVFYKDSM